MKALFHWEENDNSSHFLFLYPESRRSPSRWPWSVFTNNSQRQLRCVFCIFCFKTPLWKHVRLSLEINLFSVVFLERNGWLFLENLCSNHWADIGGVELISRGLFSKDISWAATLYPTHPFEAICKFCTAEVCNGEIQNSLWKVFFNILDNIIWLRVGSHQVSMSK